MSSNTSIRYLRLFLHAPDGQKHGVGYLSQYGDVMRVTFDEAYIQNPQRLTLSLSYQGANDAQTQAILRATRDVRLVRNDAHWPAYFQNLLPEGHNRERLAQERGCQPEDELELLAAAGHDLMGACEVEPVAPQDDIPHAVRDWHTALGFEELQPEWVQEPVQDAASLPGVVTKFSAVHDGRRYVVKRGGVAGDVILKLPSTQHPDLVENEFTGYQLCAALGLDCAKASVISRAQAELPEHIPFDHLLAVQRFDRHQGRRVHMEEFAQALRYEPRQKYGKGLMQDYGLMLRLLDNYSSRPAQDVREFLARFVAFILMGNTDAHLKNWALMYPDGRTPRLAPLYDPVCVSAFFADLPAGAYGINREIDRKLRAFSWADMQALIDIAQLPRPAVLLKHCQEVVKQAQADWPALLPHAPKNVCTEVLARLQGGVGLAL